MRQPVGFGVIGANSFVANAAVLPAIEAADAARLIATASRSGDVPEHWAGTDVGSYEAVLDHADVEAVYIPLPNGMHREWTEKAAAAGKHVLCEKPLASDAATARAMAAACTNAGVLLAEAWMTPFSRRYQTVMDAVSDIEPPQRVESSFTFTIGPDASDNYRWDPIQGGGALLDVGIYCLGPVVELFDATPSGIHATQRLASSRVDAWTAAELTWADGASASIRCSFVDEEAQTLHVTGMGGALGMTNEAFTGGVTADTYVHVRDVEDGYGHTVTLSNPNDPYQAMVEAFADAVRGKAEWPRPVERSIEMLTLIERIREAANV